MTWYIEIKGIKEIIVGKKLKAESRLIVGLMLRVVQLRESWGSTRGISSIKIKTEIYRRHLNEKLEPQDF